MKFRGAVFDIVDTMRAALMIAFIPTVRAIFASPSLLLSPAAIRRVIFQHIWTPFGEGGDTYSSGERTRLITPHAHGVVLDIGAGHGSAAKYLDRTVVSKYIALEPNVLMHEQIRKKAHAAGYTEADGTLLVLSCGAEDTASIASALSGKVETIISIMTLCTVPRPQATICNLVEDVLAPGGTLIFHEHIRAEREDVAWWQTFWTPIWGNVFDGCCLDRPTTMWIKDLVDESGESVWVEGETWDSEGFEGEHLFPRKNGRFVKKE
ncbi:S-adenosyl-L-methionine-dependent methyltransferase [Mycena rebaudengoi]|nr:S-adenosyl-L-methionine-dependent methyltransferase [Mycena rebaudengoi]